MSTKTYELRIFDEPLAQFRFNEDKYGEKSITGLEINSDERHLLPLNMVESPTDSEMQRFVLSRKIPRKRAFAEKLFAAFDLNPSDIEAIINVTNGVSINDSYSIVPADHERNFADYNIYQNDFDEGMQILALTGDATAANAAPSSSTELTGSGNFPKALRRIDGDLYIYKAGYPEHYSNTGMEPYSEVLAAEVASALRIDHVRYDLESWSGTLCTSCRIFNSANVSFVPFFMAMPEDKAKSMTIEKAVEYFSNINVEESEKFKDMLVFDAIIYNMDRHMGNYGVLRDDRSGEILRMAPVFDNNSSMWTFEHPESDDLDYLLAKAQSANGAYSLGLHAQAQAVAGERQLGLISDVVSLNLEYPASFSAYASAFPSEKDIYTEARFKGLQKVFRKNAQQLEASCAARQKTYLQSRRSREADKEMEERPNIAEVNTNVRQQKTYGSARR